MRPIVAVFVLVIASVLLLAAFTDPKSGKIVAPWWLGPALLALVAVTCAALWVVPRRPRRSPPRILERLGLAIFLTACLHQPARAQSPFTWQQIRDKFEAAN